MLRETVRERGVISFNCPLLSASCPAGEGGGKQGQGRREGQTDSETGRERRRNVEVMKKGIKHPAFQVLATYFVLKLGFLSQVFVSSHSKTNSLEMQNEDHLDHKIQETNCNFL